MLQMRTDTSNTEADERQLTHMGSVIKQSEPVRVQVQVPLQHFFSFSVELLPVTLMPDAECIMCKPAAQA